MEEYEEMLRQESLFFEELIEANRNDKVKKH